MKKGVIFVSVALAIVIVVCLMYLSGLISLTGFSIIDLSSCGTLDSPNTIYVLTQNVSSSGTCMNITASNVTLNCQGFTINFSNSNSGAGVYSNSTNTTVKNCVIIQGSEQEDSYGIEFSISANKGTIDNNSITTNGTSSYGIYLNGADNNTITNTNTTSAGDFSWGMYFGSSEYNNATDSADYNNVTNFKQNGDYGCVYMLKGNYNNFVNASVRGLRYDCLYLVRASNNNFTNCYIDGNDWACAVIAFSTDQNSFVNSILTGVASICLYPTAGIYNLTNCTMHSVLSDRNFINGGQLNVFWYADVYVNDSNGNAIDTANVSVTDINLILQNWSLTNSSGYIQRLTLREYMQNATAQYFDTNYTFNASKTGYSYDSDTGPVNLTTNYIGSNYIGVTLTDNSALTALFGTNPVNNYNSNSSSITFDFKCSYNSTVSYIQLWTNTTGTWKVNYTNSSYTNNTWLNITVSGIPNNQNHKWAVYCNTSGSSDWTGNRTFGVDTVAPVAYQGTNPVNNYTSSISSVTFDIKCTDNVRIGEIELYSNWVGTWESVYSNSSYTNNTWLNVTLTGGSNGNYVWAVVCTDYVGNTNNTGNRTLIISVPSSPAPPAGGGGGGGGTPTQNVTNQTNQTQENETQNLGNITEGNKTEESGNGNDNKIESPKIKINYLWIIFPVAVIIVIVVLIVIFSRIKKVSSDV